MNKPNRSSGQRSGPRNNDRGRFNSGPREMHKTVCADCGVECEVPFKPVEGRDVFCRDCFSKHKPQRREF